MHLVIISCTPRIQKYSNTKKIIKAFVKGVEAGGGTTETYYLANRETWDDIRAAFYKNRRILFAIPLFVECVPGIMLEFLETLSPKVNSQEEKRTKISFLVQGGFNEASQLRCCEQYLETLPSYLGCDYAGTLIKGGMFALRFMEDDAIGKRLDNFQKMGEIFAKKGYFSKRQVTAFAKPEYYSKPFMTIYTVVVPLEKFLFTRIAKKQWGCKEPLDAKPLEKYIR